MAFVCFRLCSTRDRCNKEPHFKDIIEKNKAVQGGLKQN